MGTKETAAERLRENEEERQALLREKEAEEAASTEPDESEPDEASGYQSFEYMDVRNREPVVIDHVTFGMGKKCKYCRVSFRSLRDGTITIAQFNETHTAENNPYLKAFLDALGLPHNTPLAHTKEFVGRKLRINTRGTSFQGKEYVKAHRFWHIDDEDPSEDVVIAAITTFAGVKIA